MTTSVRPRATASQRLEEIAAANRQRGAELRKLCQAHGLSSQELTEVIDSNLSIEKAEGWIKERADRPFPSFPAQVRAIMRAANSGSERDARLDRVRQMAVASGMSEQVSSDGGFLVQPEFATQILDRVYMRGALLSRCNRAHVAVNRSGLFIQAYDDTNRASGQRLGGISTIWANDGDAATPAKPKLRRLDASLGKILSFWYMTEELRLDAPGAEAQIFDAFANEIIDVVEAAVVVGQVPSMTGLLQAGCLITVAAQGGQSAGTFVTLNALDMFKRLYASPNVDGVAWLIHQDHLSSIMQFSLVAGAANTTSVVQPYVAYVHGDDAAPFGRLLGRPVLPCEACSAPGTVGDVLLVDLNEYLVVDKPALYAVSMHLKFLADEAAFRISYRVHGQPIWAKAVTPRNGTNTISSVVALAAR